MDKKAKTSKVLRDFSKEKLEEWEASEKSGALCGEESKTNLLEDIRRYLVFAES